MDSTLPSPSALSSPSLGFEGLPGRRRKKRTSIETNVRVALERSFITVRTRDYKTIAQHALPFKSDFLKKKKKFLKSYAHQS